MTSPEAAEGRRFRLTTILGARPQFVKASAVSRALGASGAVDEAILHTGQHYDDVMSASFFRELELAAPAWNLGVADLSHGAMTGRMMEGAEAVLARNRPDAVLVYGDTNSTLAGALAAAKLAIPVIHCEAGLRSGRGDAPEEINRIVVDHVSSLLLAPSAQAMRNLDAESLASRAVAVGDVMFDATLFARGKALRDSPVLSQLRLAERSYDVLTLHRAENVDEPQRLERLLDYARVVAGEREVVFPVHPRTRKRLEGLDLKGLRIAEPLGYLDFHRLLAGAFAVCTDSGGVQKEAYFHGKPCVTLRDETEWVETVEAGWNRLWTTPDYRAPKRSIADYGEGRAAEACVNAMLRLLKEKATGPRAAIVRG
jgi:UDP-GlcNAc3NAcA epimerase